MQYRLPTIYPYGEGVSEGGLIAYIEHCRSVSKRIVFY
jgi:hypothetical protein